MSASRPGSRWRAGPSWSRSSRRTGDELADHPWGHWAEQAAAASPAGASPAGRSAAAGRVTRWNAKKDLSLVPLRPELVIEVAYDHMEGDRFRHTAQLRRWRPDRTPLSCTYEQLERPVVVQP